MKGLYVSGWLSRGPNGVIATTMMDAYTTAEIIAGDYLTQSDVKERPELDIAALSKTSRVVSWEDWESLDRIERERGSKLGKDREKITSVQAMLDLLQ